MNINPTLLHKLRQHPVLKAIHRVSLLSHHPVYLVGGAVRDLLLGILPEKDFDFVTDSIPEQLARQFSHKVSGNLISLNDNPPSYRVIFYRKKRRIEVDIAAFRGKNLSEDLLMRDFSINAIAFSVTDLYSNGQPTLYDPAGGRTDLQAKTLRVTTDRSFDDDPLRILRGVRIARAYDLAIDAHTQVEMVHKRHQLTAVAVERIRSEFFKTIGLPDAQQTLAQLDTLGILSLLIPYPFPDTARKRQNHQLLPSPEGLAAVSRCEWALDNLEFFSPTFPDDLRTHFAEEIEADVLRASLFKFAGLIQDLSRQLLLTAEASAAPDAQEEAGMSSTLATFMISQCKLGKKASRIVQTTVEGIRRAASLFHLPKLTERVCFRYFYDLGSEGLDALLFFWVCAPFIGAHQERSDLDRELQNLTHPLLYYYYAQYTVTRPQPLVSGSDLMERFGLRQGEVIGTLLDRVAQAEAAGQLSSQAEALALVSAILNKS